MRPANSYIFRRRWAGRSAFGCTWKIKMSALLFFFYIASESDFEFGMRGLKDRLTRPWLFSLNRVNSWLEVSKRVLQVSSNHSRRGPPQSRATEKSHRSEQFGHSYFKAFLCWSNVPDATAKMHKLTLKYLNICSSYADGLFTFLILEHDFKVFTPIWHREVPCSLQGLNSKRERVKFITGTTWLLWLHACFHYSQVMKQLYNTVRPCVDIVLFHGRKALRVLGWGACTVRKKLKKSSHEIWLMLAK